MKSNDCSGSSRDRIRDPQDALALLLAGRRTAPRDAGFAYGHARTAEGWSCAPSGFQNATPNCAIVSERRSREAERAITLGRIDAAGPGLALIARYGGIISSFRPARPAL